MASNTTTFRATTGRAFRRILPWALALAVATCTDDQNGPSAGGTGYFSFRPVYGISNSLSQFGIVADSIHVTLTRPVNEVVLDTTVFFPPDSTSLRLALPVHLEQSPETLAAVVEIKSGGTILFVDSVDVPVLDGPPSPANIPTIVLDYVGPGKNVAAITILPGDTTMKMGDTLFFTSTAIDSSAQPVASFFTAWKTSDTTVARINAQGRLIAPNVRGTVKVIGYTPTGITDTTTLTFAPVPVVITADSGGTQSGLAGDSLAALFVARVKGPDSLGISGIAVRFAAVTAGGAVRDTQTLITDLQGRVRTRGVLGTTAQGYSYSATVVGTALTRTFTATATAGAAVAIAIQGGNAQVDSAGRALPLPLTVRVADAFDNPVVGAKVYWSRPVGTGTRSADSSFTDAAGLASITYILGTVGLDSVRADLAGTSAFVGFGLTAINGAAATVLKDLGDAQADTVGRLLTDSLVVTVQSATAQPVVGTPVTWTVLSGGATSTDTVITDATGRAAVAYTLGTLPGIDSVRAQAGGASATFTATAVPGAASVLTLVSGSPQSDTIGKTLALPFVVEARDAFGNLTAGTPVIWNVDVGSGLLSADTTLTDGAGQASVNYTLGPTPGADTISATLPCGCSTVGFFVTALTAAPASLQRAFGDGQSITAGATATDSLVVTVLDGASTPMAGAQIIWTVLRGGAVATDTTYSDALGHAAVQYIAGTLTGTDSVEAKAFVGGVSTIFTETVVADAPVSIFAVSGDLQADTAGHPLPAPLVVEVQDQFNNPVSGTAVAFSRVAGSGLLSADTVLTDGQGRASVSYVLGAIPGTDTVRAELVATGGTVDFSAVTLAAAPASIVTIGGDSQTVVVNTVADTFEVLVRDGSNNPVVGAKVNWAFIPAVGSFTEILPAGILQSFTDSLGVARGIYTAGTSAGTVRIEAQVGALIDSLYLFATAAAPGAIAIQSGDAQADTVGRAIPLPFVAKVTDGFGNPVPGTWVVFTRVSGGGTLFADSVATDAAGLAAVGYLFGNVPGVDTIRATLSGTGAFVDFEATAIPGTPATLTITSGFGQSQAVGTALTDTLSVQVYGGGGLPLFGTPVVWTVLRGGSLDVDTTFTDTLGFARAIYTLGTVVGTDSVQAGTVTGGLSVIFTETATAGAATTISLVGGDAQVDTVGRTLPAPLTAFVSDTFGNLVTGAAVTFTTISGGGAPAQDTVLSDGAGQAFVTYTLGALPGTDTVRAQLVGTSAFLDFTATAVSGAPAFLLKLLGDGQQDTVFSTLTDSLVVQLVDAGASPIPNSWIYWATAGATVSADSTLTDANGKAAVRVTLGGVAVNTFVLAHNADTTIAAGFTVRAVAGAPTQISAVAGIGQTGEVSTPLPIDFGAFVQDAYGNPVVGQAVTWTNLAGFTAAGLPDTTLTDSVGIAYLSSPLLGALAGEDSLEAQILGGSATTLFTAIATAGPVGALQYVSGTGQSGTVGTLLPSQFNVQVLDAGSNPISGTWVHWAVIAGNGSFPTDSSLTDGSGVAKITLTLGTLAGIDSAIATVAGVADTVTFYAQAVADAPAALVKVSGDSQSSAVSTILPAPLVVRATDQYGNPVAGVTVDFGITSGPGGGFANSSIATDSLGEASSGDVNLAATAGTTIADATSSAIASDTVYFTIVALPIGTSRQWIGAVDNNWGDPNNWAPASLPTASDNVYVPASAANQPMLDVSRTIGGLAVETGADLNVQGNILTLNGDLVADGTLSRTSGHTILAGSSATARGHLGAVQTTGNISLSGPADATSNFQVTAGSLNVGGQTLTINGDLDISGSGQFVMAGAADSVQVNGNASWNGSTANGLLTSGVVVLTGDFSAGGASVFRAGGTHRFVFAGGSPQTIAFASAALGGNQFQELFLANTSGYVPTGDLAAAGAVTLAAGTINGGGTAFLGGDLSIPAVTAWNMAVTDLGGSPTVFPDSLQNDLHVSGTTTLPGDLVVLGNYAQAAGTLTVGGHRLQVDGTFDLSGTAQFAMQDAADTVDIAQGATWDGSTSTGLLTDGVLVLRGNFFTPSSATFRAGGTHTIRFEGATPQTVQLNNATPGGTQFQNAVFANATSVNFASGFVVAGTSTLSAGTVTAPGQRALLGGDLLDVAGTTWSADTTDFFGTVTQLPDTLHGTMMVEGAVTLGDSLWVTGDLLHAGGALTLNGNLLRVDGAMLVIGTAEVTMQNAADVLDIGGNVTWQGSNATGLLTAGSAIFRGDFTEPSPAPTYQASGTHTTIFAGTVPQTVTFTGASPSTDAMRDLAVSNAAGVTFVNDFAVTQNVNVIAGTVTSAGTASVGGTVSGSAGFDWRPELTRFYGTVAALPDSFPRSVEMATPFTLSQPFKVGGALVLTAGDFDPAGWTLTVDSALSVVGTANLVMQSSADSVDVGSATFSGSTTPGVLTAGVLIVRGDLNVPSSSNVFQAAGTHRTVLEAPAPATIATNNATVTGNRFQDLEFRGNGTYTLGSPLAVAGSLTKAAGGSISITGNDLRTIETRELALDGVGFDSVQVVARGAQLPSLDNVSFTRAAPDQVTLQVVSGGEAAPKAWTNINFAGTAYTTGKMVQVVDSAEDGLSIVVRMMNSFPLNGEAYESELGSNQPAIEWTRLVFADPPQAGSAGNALTPIRVAVLDPAGDTLSSYGNTIGVAIGTNPSGATLGGTTAQLPSSGIATFSDLTIDNAGLGYTLTAGTTDLPVITSGTFDITAPLPVGFDAQWLGTTSTDWFDPSNWSTGVVPTAATNVYLSGVAANDPMIPADSAFVKRLQVAPGAALDFGSGAKLVADSTVEAFGAINLPGTLELRGSGDLVGTIAAQVNLDTLAARTLSGTTQLQSIQVNGDLTIGPDTLTVTNDLNTGYSGRLIMQDGLGLADVGGAADFSGGSTDGYLTAGTLRVSGDLHAGGSGPLGFAPSGGHLTILNGGAGQVVAFNTADSVTGSHFGRLQVSTAGVALMAGRYDALGDLLITSGATLTDSLNAGFEAHGFTTLDAGGTLAVTDLRTRGGIGVAVGATYSVATTTYYGFGAFPINPAPYDTLVLELQGQASGDFAITGDLRISGTGAGFDPNGHTVAVGGSVNINNGGNLTMQNAADVLTVAGSFFTNGDSTKGLLTDGLLQIAGDFRQAADGSGESFRASGNHVTRFTGGLGAREIEFDSPSTSATDLGGSHFAILDLPDGVDSLGGRVPAAVSVAVGGSITFDTIGGGYELASYGPLSILASSDSVHAQTLEAWGGLNKAGAGAYLVGLTRLFGGSGTLPALPYIDLHIAHTGYTLGTDQVIAGNLLLGILAGEIGPPAATGELTVGGHTLTVGGQVSVLGLGFLTMGAGDSVDVTGDITFRGAPSDGHLTGGTLVARGLFNTVGSDAFQADAAHRTVMLGAGVQDIYPTANTWFGKLYLLGGERRIRSPEPVVVLDSLVLGSSTAALTDTFGFSNGAIEARGPILTVNSSAIRMDGSMRIDVSAPQILGSYSVVTTILGGAGQTVPNLTYGGNNIVVIGTAQLGSGIDIGGGSFSVDGSAAPADLDLNGNSLAVGNFSTTGEGTLTSTVAGSALLVRSNATFNGGNETGHLTQGGLTVQGSFTQDVATSDSSYVSSGSHTTVFADSASAVNTFLNSMFAGASRFNDVAVYGKGVSFFGQARATGAIHVLDAGATVNGGTVYLGPQLTDPAYDWNVDTTYVTVPLVAFPDTIAHNVIFGANDTLSDDLWVKGELRLEDTLVVNGFYLATYGELKVMGPGVLQMTNAADRVQAAGVATFEGAVSTGLMSEGRLMLFSDLVTGNVTPGSFDATGNHVTVLLSEGTSNLTFAGGPQGYGPNDLVVNTTGLNLPFGMKVKGTFSDSLTSGTLVISSGGQTLDVGQMDMHDADLSDVTISMGDQSILDTVTFHFSAPPSGYAVNISGPGRATPLDLHALNFPDYALSGILLAVGDTLANGTGIDVRMFGSTPFNGSSKTLLSGLDPTTAAWSHLAFSSPFPATVDSIVPFGLTMVVKEPDNTNRADVSAALDASLLANPNNVILSGGTTANFDGQSANFFNLHVDTLGTGLVLHVEVQGRPLDFAEATFDAINPAPAGAVIFNGAISTDWTDPGNWSTSSVPSPAQDVFIPGGASVLLPPSSTYSVSTLVLGSGASLDLGFGSTLTVTGNAYAGQTITGSGTLEIAGGASQISGTFPTLKVTGNASAVGRTTITGDLIVDGGGAEFNVGGMKVDVSGTLFTQNGGLFTMDGSADTLYIGSASLAGGDETGRLTDGVLIVQGSGIDQAFGDPKSFYATGSHLTVFADGGSSTAVNIGDPHASQFARVSVQNPNGVDFNESGLGFVRFAGDLSVSAGGVMTADTIGLDGGLIVAQPGDSIDIERITTPGTLQVNGGYNVRTTELVGTGQVIQALPYQSLVILGANAILGAPVDARSVTLTGGGSLDVNGRALRVDSLFGNAALGALLMDDPADSVVVNVRAQFNGTTPAIPMTAGYLEIRGDLQVSPNYNAFVATAGHVTRFVGAASHVMNFPGEGSATPLGTVVIDSGAVLFNDNSLITGDLILHDGLLADSSQNRDLEVLGSVHGDNGSSTELLLGKLTLSGALDWQGSGPHYQPATTGFAGAAQVIPQLPYGAVEVTGTASLAGDAAFGQGQVRGYGVLTLGGHRLDISTGGLLVTDSAHLVMQAAGDTLQVLGTAIFSTDANTTGDYTAGVIRAVHFTQVQGSYGGTTSFVQTGSNRIVPQAGDTIEFSSGGPAGSMLKTLVLNGTGGPVYSTGPSLWIADSLVILGAADSLVGNPGSEVIVGFPNGTVGTVTLGGGTLAFDGLGVAGPLNYTTGDYNVALTKFIGAGQTVPAGVPYQNVEVQYAATLGGDLALTGGGQRFQVGNGGTFDLGGHHLSVDSFATVGPSVLRMDADADTLTAEYASFNGGNTEGQLTAGVLQVATFSQGADYDTRSFAPSGTHLTEFVTLGIPPEGGYDITFNGPSDATTSHFNRAHFLSTSISRPWANLYFADTLYINNRVDPFTNVTFTAQGPVVMGSVAEVNVDSLRMADTLIIDPSATTFQVNHWVFGPTAKTPPEWTGYSNVHIEGNLSLTAPLDLAANVFVRGGAVLQLNGHTFTAEQGFTLQDTARLIMTTAEDTLITSSATFAAGATGTDLAGGLIRMSGQFYQANFTSDSSFMPTGTVVEFTGGSDQSIQFASPNTSYFGDWRIAGKGMYLNTQVVTRGDFAMDATSSLLDWSNGNVDFFGTVTLAPGAVMNDPDALTLVTFHDSLTVGTPANYSVINTAFEGIDSIPRLPYQFLYLRNGANVILGDSLEVQYTLALQGSVDSSSSLRLNGHYAGVGQLTIDGPSTLIMDNAADTLTASGNANFWGDDETGSLTAGVLRIGGDFNQQSANSALAYAPTGTRTEFFGTGTHVVSFQSPFNFQSRFADLSVLDGGTLQPVTSVAVTGTTVIDTSSTYDGQLIPGGGDTKFYGKVRLLDLAQLLAPLGAPAYGTAEFRDSLIMAPTATYSVFNTIFQGTDGIPDASYVHMYLRQGVHLTLTHPLSMTGGLNIQNDNITGNPADTVTIRLNGHRLVANTLGITGYGRFTMDSVADTLVVLQDAIFRGVDQDTSLSAGVIQIGRGFAQNGQFSARSFAPAGTRTEFYGSLTHQASFTDPAIAGGSYFADLAVINTGTLQPLSQFAVAGSTTIGSTAHFNGQSIPLGSVVDFFGPVTVQGGGDFLAGTSPAYFNFYGNGGLTVGTGAGTPYDVLNTGFVNNNAVPDLPYRNLFLAGTDSVRSNDVTASGNITVTEHTVIDNGYTLHAADSLIVDGASAMLENVNGFAIADGVFTTVNGGTYVSQSAQAAATFQNVVWNGGNETGLLTAGGMSVNGDFTQGGPDPESFVADSGFTSQFGGTGTHQVYFSTPSMTGGGGSHFGGLSFTTDAGIVLNVLSDIWAEGTLTNLGSSIPTVQNGTVPLRTLTARDVNVQRITFDHVQFHLAKTTGAAAGAGNLDNVTFQNFLTTEDQFVVELPGEATQYDWGGFTFTQLNTGDTGHYLVATDTDGGTPNVLDISLGTNNWGVTDPPFYVGFNGALIFPFAP